MYRGPSPPIIVASKPRTGPSPTPREAHQLERMARAELAQMLSQVSAEDLGIQRDHPRDQSFPSSSSGKSSGRSEGSPTANTTGDWTSHHSRRTPATVGTGGASGASPSADSDGSSEAEGESLGTTAHGGGGSGAFHYDSGSRVNVSEPIRIHSGGGGSGVLHPAAGRASIASSHSRSSSPSVVFRSRSPSPLSFHGGSFPGPGVQPPPSSGGYHDPDPSAAVHGIGRMDVCVRWLAEMLQRRGLSTDVNPQPNFTLVTELVATAADKLHLAEAPLLVQAQWLMTLACACVADAAQIGHLHAEHCLNAVKNMMGSDHPWVRAFACMLVRRLAHGLNPAGRHLEKQVTIVVNNLVATLQDGRDRGRAAHLDRFLNGDSAGVVGGDATGGGVTGLDASGPVMPQFGLCRIVCVASMMDIARYWTEHPSLPQGSQGSQAEAPPFLTTALRAMFGLVHMAPPPTARAEFILRYTAADGVRSLLAGRNVWQSLSRPVVYDALRNLLRGLAAYHAGHLDDISVRLLLRAFDGPVLEETLNLPNFLSALLSSLLRFLAPLDSWDEHSNHHHHHHGSPVATAEGETTGDAAPVPPALASPQPTGGSDEPSDDPSCNNNNNNNNIASNSGGQQTAETADGAAEISAPTATATTTANATTGDHGSRSGSPMRTPDPSLALDLRFEALKLIGRFIGSPDCGTRPTSPMRMVHLPHPEWPEITSGGCATRRQIRHLYAVLARAHSRYFETNGVHRSKQRRIQFPFRV